MGYRNKGLQEYDGKPLIEHLITRLQPQVSELMISANADLERYARYGYPVLQDTLKDEDEFWGPLAGIHAGLLHCKTPYLAVTPCDTPFIPLDFVQTLAEMGIPAYYEEQALFCLLPTSLAPELGTYLKSGGRKVHAWWRSLEEVHLYQAAPSTPIKNINHLSDLDLKP
jgi:molybdopterin-guanine dinucleotide biosynthesis protein A